MAVELDVSNPNLRLAPGMYPEVRWPVHNSGPSLLIPPSSIVTTTEKTFVVRVRNGIVEWVPVMTGASVGTLVEVLGDLKPGEMIAKHGTDELRAGARVEVRTSTN